MGAVMPPLLACALANPAFRRLGAGAAPARRARGARRGHERGRRHRGHHGDDAAIARRRARGARRLSRRGSARGLGVGSGTVGRLEPSGRALARARGLRRRTLGARAGRGRDGSCARRAQPRGHTRATGARHVPLPRALARGDEPAPSSRATRVDVSCRAASRRSRSIRPRCARSWTRWIARSRRCRVPACAS